VASLSLGSVAEMHFRLHSKYLDTEGHRKVAMSILLRHVGAINVWTAPHLTSDSSGRRSSHGRSWCARVL
jgi:hypothetical protein